MLAFCLRGVVKRYIIAYQRIFWVERDTQWSLSPALKCKAHLGTLFLGLQKWIIAVHTQVLRVLLSLTLMPRGLKLSLGSFESLWKWKKGLNFFFLSSKRDNENQRQSVEVSIIQKEETLVFSNDHWKGANHCVHGSWKHDSSYSDGTDIWDPFMKRIYK